MPAGYTPLPNPRSNPEREIADDFDLDEDVDNHHYKSTPPSLTHNNRRTPSAIGHVFPRETTSIPGTYDFEREYDFPPPGSPPRPSSRALPNDFGNSNGLLPVAPVQIVPKPRVPFYRRAFGAILPTHYARVPTTQTRPARLTGGGIENDGVFANIMVKPQLSRVIRTEDGDIYMAPENTQEQTPPVRCLYILSLCLEKIQTSNIFFSPIWKHRQKLFLLTGRQQFMLLQAWNPVPI
jgi:hypothetical protein